MSPTSSNAARSHDGEKHYRTGEFVPGAKGSLADMEAVGAVEWVDAPVREAKPKAAPKAPAKRKAVT